MYCRFFTGRRDLSMLPPKPWQTDDEEGEDKAAVRQVAPAPQRPPRQPQPTGPKRPGGPTG